MKAKVRIKFKPILTALLAAAFYGISTPFSKLLLEEISPFMIVALLYLGAGIGMLCISFVNSIIKKEKREASLTKKELKYIISMILLDIAAPILFMLGLKNSTAGSASLLNNFEVVATSLIALVVFKESVGKKMWVAIILITVASILLSVKDFSSFSFSLGSILIILACVAWGFENNTTRMLSLKDPSQIVIIKGFGSGIGALIIALSLKHMPINIEYILLTLLLGFFAYGLSIFFYIRAQRDLGAARTSAYYATAPFIGVLISWIVLKETLSFSFLIALGVMLSGTYFAVSERHTHLHIHKKLAHEHIHSHSDMHHNHKHDSEMGDEHSHLHSHEDIKHDHTHSPDLHHRHKH